MSNSNIRHKICQGVEIHVRGTVQGVGFRPFIYNLALRCAITGSVINSGDGVIVTAFADTDVLDRFIAEIRDQAPPLSTISSISHHGITTDVIPADFRIFASSTSGTATTAIPPDVAICDDCLRELLSPADNRFSYPFINCTNCGPRFTIVESIPYDRPKTSMKVFPMCPSCDKEYHDPTNRRFHAQPNACPDCGPRVFFCEKNGTELESNDPVADATQALNSGEVIGLRGLGGFHLVVDATSADAVAKLRQRKNRPDKPLAVMVEDLEQAQKICHLSQDEADILSSPAHPIVLLTIRNPALLAHNLAPGISELGLMLPYTPLHHLLFRQQSCPDVLVMTSGNLSGNPICTGNEEGIEKLSQIVDHFLLHDRDIVTRVDDSVVRIIGETPHILRRARGFVPAPLPIEADLPPILGCGAGLKNTFCLGRGNALFPSQHIGDLDNLEVYDFYQESIDHMQKLLQLTPEAVACDLHPDYLSSRYAEERGLPLYRVQHHHAHATAVMAEYGLQEDVLAVILDGTGLGDDNTIWGGEFFQCDLTRYKRLGHLSHLPLPGGDKAAQEPWRMALSALFAMGGSEALQAGALPTSLGKIDPSGRKIVASMLENGFNSPLSSSCGRLFDSISGLLGLRQRISFEGQAAMELEALARQMVSPNWIKNYLPNSHTDLSDLVQKKAEKWEISSPEFVKMLLLGMKQGESAQSLALQFHAAFVYAITKLVEYLHQSTGINKVVLGGGCFQNSLLLQGTTERLLKLGFSVYSGSLLPANDGSISTGQTITGGLQHVSRNTNEGDQGPG